MDKATRITVGMLGLVACGLWAAGATAAIIGANTSSYGSQSAFAASSTDLINNGQATLLGVSDVYGMTFGSVSSLNNGTSVGATGSLDVGNNSGATFILNTTTNIKGYDISSIVSLAGWDDGRANQDIQIAYHKVGEAVATWHVLGTYNNAGATGGDFSTKITVFDDQSGYIMTGVDKISFAALNAHSYGTLVTEWDIFGTSAPIPEPAALGLLALGGMLLARRRVTG
jgi:hypothetical protein